EVLGLALRRAVVDEDELLVGVGRGELDGHVRQLEGGQDDDVGGRLHRRLDVGPAAGGVGGFEGLGGAAQALGRGLGAGLAHLEELVLAGGVRGGVDEVRALAAFGFGAFVFTLGRRRRRLGGGVFLGAGRRRRRLGHARLLRAAAATRRQQQGQRCQQRPPSLASHLSPPSFRESRRGAQDRKSTR